MRVRFWVAEALTGQVLREVDVLDWSASQDMAGHGDLSGSLSLDLATRTGATPDYPAIRRLLAAVQPWQRSIVVTAAHTDAEGLEVPESKRVLGEYVLTRTVPSTASPMLGIEGVTWEAYPSYLVHETAFKRTGDAGTAARDLVASAFTGATIAVPAFTAGWQVTIDRAARSGQIADVLREVVDAEDGIEWCVDVTPVWSGGRLASVTRTVLFGAPEIRRQTGLVFEAPEPMTNQGNCIILGGGEDATTYARAVFASGSGAGDKKLRATASNSGLSAQGYLNATRLLSVPDVQTQPSINALARGELARSQGRKGGAVSLPRDPWEVEAELDRLPTVPRVGDVVRLRHRQSWAWPGAGVAQGQMAIDEMVRVGRLRYASPDSMLDTVTMEAI